MMFLIVSCDSLMFLIVSCDSLIGDTLFFKILWCDFSKALQHIIYANGM
jgi:hypothetical protein